MKNQLTGCAWARPVFLWKAFLMGLHRVYAFGARAECSPFPKQKNAGSAVKIPSLFAEMLAFSLREW